jgi:hypothetical protein
MLANTIVVEHSEFLFKDIHIYIFEEYERIWDEYIMNQIPSVPSIYEIVHRVSEVIHNRISELLSSRYVLGNDLFNEDDFQQLVALYSSWFDQQADRKAYLDEVLLREVTKFFCLHQLFHERDGVLVNQPVLGVW